MYQILSPSFTHFFDSTWGITADTVCNVVVNFPLPGINQSPVD